MLKKNRFIKIYEILKTEQFAEYSIVVPIHNQENLIKPFFDNLLNCVSINFELIVIFDNCKDRSIIYFNEFFKTKLILCKNLVRCTYIESKKDLFETKSDNLGILNSNTDYIIEIQIDMLLKDINFDNTLLNAIKSYDDILMISGRSTNSLEDIFHHYKKCLGTEIAVAPTILTWLYRALATYLIKKITKTKESNSNIISLEKDVTEFKVDDFINSKSAGRTTESLNYDVDIPKSIKNKIFISQTVCRGPLVIDKNKFLELGGFDENIYIQGFDDHDLSLRGWILKKYVCGFVPIKFISPLHFGNTRKEKKLIWYLNFTIKLIMLMRKRNKSVFNLNYRQFNFNDPEIRNFN